MTNVYLELTEHFNAARFRAIISSGQAVVLHRLAIMSKDGDWIVREDTETMTHLIEVLARRGGHYRFGAPLDVRWMAGGWSAHLEFRMEQIRVRTDFVTRPPRLSDRALAQLWEAQTNPPVVNAPALAELKKTNREKDYAVIGELARLMVEPRDQLLYSRSARDLLALATRHASELEGLLELRPVLRKIAAGRARLEAALDAERRDLVRANEERLATYRVAAGEWASRWPDVERETAGLPLAAAHAIVTERALEFLPFEP